MAGSVLAGTKTSSALLGNPPWTPMTLANTWVNTGAGFATAQYRFWPLKNEVEIIGNIKNGTTTNGTAICNALPFTPATQQNFNVVVVVGAATGTPYVAVTTAGLIVVEGLPSGTVQFSFWGHYSLDA